MRFTGPMQTVLPLMAEFPGQEYRFKPGPRQVEMYVKEPTAGINGNTGLMLLSHNWGGTWKLTAPWCDILCDKFNLICISVNYLQSGWTQDDPEPYDHGPLQAMDCLRALYHVRKLLAERGVRYNPRRCYAAGASGGGNVSLMVNKLAPQSFGCVIDLCGMPGLTDDIAFGVGRLNAHYSPDPGAANYLSPAMREIRDPGNPAHLALQFQRNSANQVVIVHGLDDDYCSVTDKILIFRNMIAAGFRPAGHFVTPAMVDGIVLITTGHAVGDRPYVIAEYGKPYIAERGEFISVLPGPDDFDQRHVVTYPVTGGVYRVDFAVGAPVLEFAAAEA